MEISAPKTVVWSLWDTCWYNEFLGIGHLEHYDHVVSFNEKVSIDYIINAHCSTGFPFFYFQDPVDFEKEHVWR